MKKILLLGILFSIFITHDVQAVDEKKFSDESSTNSIALLKQKQWIHGSKDCKANNDPSIDVFQYDESSYILRQNKCLSYEAPFIYVFIGEEKILVVDTGAAASPKDFPLYDTIQSLNKKHIVDGEVDKREILVVHSHSHSDHYGGDSQFIGKPNVTVVEPNDDGINEYFAFKNWPDQQTKLDLGGRSITIIPTPGHQEQAISIYDPQTQWLLTGDTFYPGIVYVKNWNDYKNSIARLLSFTNDHDVSLILGAHIEMKSNAGEYYEIGTIYQPNEASLILKTKDLLALNNELQKTDKPAKISLDRMIVEPLGALPKLIGSIVGWFT